VTPGVALRVGTFAGETISFRFRFVFVSREILTPKRGHREGFKKLEKPPMSEKSFFLLLRRLKTAKEIFGKT
jgi:hypothetical protein